MAYSYAQMAVASAPGTSDVTLAPMTGELTFAAAGAVDGDKVRYGIMDILAFYEIGFGTVHFSGDVTTLVRDTVENSSNANAPIDATAKATVLLIPMDGKIPINVW